MTRQPYLQDFSFSITYKKPYEVKSFLNSIPLAGRISAGLVGADCLKVIVLLWFLSMWVSSLGYFLFLWYSVLKLRVGVGPVRWLMG